MTMRRSRGKSREHQSPDVLDVVDGAVVVLLEPRALVVEVGLFGEGQAKLRADSRQRSQRRRVFSHRPEAQLVPRLLTQRAEKRSQHLSLAELLHADADRTSGDLRLSDRRALVHLGVGAQANTVRARKQRHRREIALHRIEVDDQCRRLDGGHRVAKAR